MKLKFLSGLAGLFLISANLNAQTVYPNYTDGKIWVQLNSTVIMPGAVSKDPKVKAALNIKQFDFLNSVKSIYGITSIERPFEKAKGKGSELLTNVYEIEFSQHQKVDDLIRYIEKSKKANYAEKVPYDQISLTPNDPSYASEWGLNQIQANLAWNISTGSASVIVATVDNAIQINHPDLTNMIWVNSGEIAGNGIDDDGNGYTDDVNGWDVGDDDNNPNPLNASWNHGTHVAGTTGAETNNGTGVASIGFGITIMPVKATANSASYSSVTNGYNGIYYAALNGAHVINCSWGGTGYSATAQNIVDWAWNQGSIVVAAAGNDNLDMDLAGNAHYPSNYNNVVCVASSNSSDSKSGFSNYGSSVDVTAPGSSIYSTVPFNGYSYMSGTSMASPLVSGLLGLMISANPALPQQDYVNCLISSCDDISTQNPSYSGDLGSGRINALQALNCVTALLNNPPVADFSANFTTITAGGSVTFTDLSIYGPTTWSWNFDNQNVAPGNVSPATASSQGPHTVTYDLPGVYEVSLTVTNANGNDTETKTAYITVNSAGACNQLNLDDPTFSTNAGIHVGWTPSLYNTGGGGYVSGINEYDDVAKAEYFPSAMVGAATYCVGTYIWIGNAYTANLNSIIDFNVYDATGGSPGAILGTSSLTMQEIDSGGLFYLQFDPPVAIPGSGEIAVGVDFSSLSYAAGDTFAVVTSATAEPATSVGYEKWNTGVWYTYDDPASWGTGFTWAHYIFPELTSNPATISLSASAVNICEGESITFDATGSTYDDTLLWSFPGTTPSTSNNIIENVVYNTAGTYRAYLQVIGGGCSNYLIDSVDIVVNANPVVLITATDEEICAGDGPVTISATGATNYVWSPGGSTASSIIVNPSVSTTYSVVGSTAGCDANASITITVGQYPVLNATVTDVLCNGQATGAIDLTVSASSGNETFNWGAQGTNEDLSNLLSGNYAVIVTSEEGCATNANYTVNQPSAITVSDVTTDAGCGLSDGTSTLTIGGGTPGYTENWGAANPNALNGGVHNYTVTDANGCTYNGFVTVSNPSAPVVTVASTSMVTCFGGNDGSASVNISGGTPSYTEDWGAANPAMLSAGNYAVTVTDAANCVGSVNITITEPGNLVATPSSSNVTCFGGNDGSAALNIVGGTPGYVENWGAANPANLAAGSYSVTVTDNNGCTTNANVTITEPSAITATISAVAASCFGFNDGEATLTISGGTPAYVEDWGANNPTSLAAGTYNPTIIDANGCTYSPTVTITEPAQIVVTESTADVSCNGLSDGTASLTITGGTPAYNQNWGGNNPNALGAGNYNYTITDVNGCTANGSVTINEPTAISLSGSIVDETVTGADGSIDATVSGGTAPYNYSWDNGATTEDISGLVGGTYVLTVTDNNGCTSQMSFDVVGNGNGISDITLNANIYPNPTNNVLNIELAGSFNVELRDARGRLLIDTKANESYTIDMVSFEPAVYFLVVDQDGIQRMERIVKQ